jgi:hypothetical protein
MFEEEVSVVVEMLQIRMMMDCEEEEEDNVPSLSWKNERLLRLVHRDNHFFAWFWSASDMCPWTIGSS